MIATSYDLEGGKWPLYKDTGQSQLHFRNKQRFANYLRNSHRGKDITFRITGMDLSGLDLSGANLQGVEFINCNLDNVNFTGADLNLAKVDKCTLRGTNMTRTNLSGAEFKDCDMTGMRFKPARCKFMKIYDTLNPPFIDNKGEFQPSHLIRPRYSGRHKVRGFIELLR